MSAWIKCTDRMPEVHQQVVLANINNRKSFEPFGCCKDVGVLELYGSQLVWSGQGETRALSLDAFTHWMPIEEPLE